MFTSSITPAEAAKVARNEALQQRADRLIAKLQDRVDQDGKGLMVFVDTADEGFDLAAMLVAHFGPFADGMGHALRIAAGKETAQDSVKYIRRSPRGRMYLPRVFDVASADPDPELALMMRETLGAPNKLPGAVIIAIREGRSAILDAMRVAA
jgi:hypothetical protein